MVAILLAQRIILGKLDYKDVPTSLKPSVKEVLQDAGAGFLVTE